MKKIILAAVVALSAVTALGMAPASAEGQSKATVCHFNGTDDIVVISVADPAVQSHVDHGDARPGDAVPGMDATYGESCEIVDNPTGPSPFGAACEALSTQLMGVTGVWGGYTNPEVCDFGGTLNKFNRPLISDQLLPACFGQGGTGFLISIIDQNARCTV
jgi:hypothetical protein